MEKTQTNSETEFFTRERRIREIEHRTFKITQAEEQEEKRMKRNEERLRDLWDTNMQNNISITGVPEGEEKERTESLFEEIMTAVSPNLREMDIQIQEAQKLQLDKCKDLH